MKMHGNNCLRTRLADPTDIRCEKKKHFVLFLMIFLHKYLN
jgi:hypothetical protein